MDHVDRTFFRRTRRRRILATALAVGAFSAVVVGAAWAAFGVSTTNAGNQLTSGTVAVGANYSSPMYSITAAKPGSTQSRCVTITYTGSLAANVRMYLSTSVATSGQWTLRIDEVTGATTTDCAGAVTGANL